LQHQEKGEPAQRAVDGQRAQVRPAELAVGEDVQGEHRVSGSPLLEDEAHPSGEPHGECHPGAHTGAGVNECIGDAAEGDGGEHRAQDIEAAVLGRVPAFRHVSQRDRDHHDGQGQVDQEDPAPADGVNQEPTEERPTETGDPTQPGPQPDGPRPVFGPERRLDE
jgi:hypothetical protein